MKHIGATNEPQQIERKERSTNLKNAMVQVKNEMIINPKNLEALMAKINIGL